MTTKVFQDSTPYENAPVAKTERTCGACQQRDRTEAQVSQTAVVQIAQVNTKKDNNADQQCDLKNADKRFARTANDAVPRKLALPAPLAC